MKKPRIVLLLMVMLIVSMFTLIGCDPGVSSVDDQQSAQTAQSMQQANGKLGMPNITNFYEKATMKTIMEKCDDTNLICYAYSQNAMTGKYVYLGQCMGYGLPYGAQYTNPEYIAEKRLDYGYATLPQVDPNGLYKPEGVNATWLMLIDPATKVAKPIYFEPDLCVVPFKLPVQLLEPFSVPAGY